MHHETKARLTKANGDPIDYVPNHSRKVGFNQEANCMSPTYRRHAVGTAPHLWGIDPTPSLTVTKNGRKHTLTVKEFRTGRSASTRDAAKDNAALYARLIRLVKVADQPV